jgi:hypothetical protein
VQETDRGERSTLRGLSGAGHMNAVTIFVERGLSKEPGCIGSGPCAGPLRVIGVNTAWRGSREPTTSGIPLLLPALREDQDRTETTHRVSEVARYLQTTAILENLVHGGRGQGLSRPRAFGKESWI